MEQVKISRDELVTIIEAIEEFRDETSGPHIQMNREFAYRIRQLLRENDDDFVIAVRRALT